jgi:hypothetical protein
MLPEILRRRFEGIKGTPIDYAPLTPEEVRSVISYGREQLRRIAAGRPPLSQAIVRVDISRAGPDEVRATLSGLPIGDDWVEVVWPFERAGVRMRFRDFVRYYDDLWYPSSDDLLITNSTKTWLLEVNHEETVTYVPDGETGAM